jgi:glycosyltransferase involved in cell wall biosynthesis
VPRRILLLVTDLQIGGTPTVVRELATRLNAPPDVIVDVACLSTHGPVADQLEQNGVRVFPLNARGATDVGAINRLGRLARTNRYDTVFSFLIHANVAAAMITPFFPRVEFLQSIQTTQPYPRWHWLAQSIAHHAARKVVVPSPSVARAAQEWSDIPVEKILILANAIDAVQLSCDTGFQPVPSADAVESRPQAESPADEKQKHGLKTRLRRQPVPIGFIGRLDPIKRISDLIDAVKLLHGRIHLHIFGEGPERPVITQQISRLHLENLVSLHGAVARPQEALSQIEVLVLPSQAEGFGLVLIEAMACGIPVIGTNVPGIRDVIKPNETGLLVPPLTPAALAASIAKLLDDPALRARLQTAAFQDVQARFTWEIVLPQYRSLLGLSDRLTSTPPPLLF